ncbi:MAG: (2Fe-2S)-binding protein, partial [Actinomycetota bacterium]
DELSIFPDQTAFLDRLATDGHDGVLNIPGTTIELDDHRIEVRHPMSDDEVRKIFTDKANYLGRYQADYLPWIEEHRRAWSHESTDLVGTLRAWWEPLMALAPTLCDGVGAACLLRLDDLDILIDFPNHRVKAFEHEDFGFKFEIDRRLVENVVANRHVDWSDKLFLSCRFKAWRRGDYNEFLYNFFKSLSVERMSRAEAEAKRRRQPDGPSPDIELAAYTIERYCPHRKADL